MYCKGDVFVGLFKKRNDSTMLNCHWGLLFLGDDFDNMEFVHARGNFADGWSLEKKTRYSMVHSNSLLRLVHIGRVADSSTLIESIMQAVPAVNNDHSFTCKVWVRGALEFMNANRRIQVKNNNVQELIYECQRLADTAAMNKSANSSATTHLDIRSADACIIPPFGRSL